MLENIFRIHGQQIGMACWNKIKIPTFQTIQITVERWETYCTTLYTTETIR